MNKTELIAITAEATGVNRKDAERVLSAALEAVSQALGKHEKVQLSGFGTFEVKYRPARTARNPKTMEPCVTQAAWVPVFKPGKALKDSMAE